MYWIPWLLHRVWRATLWSEGAGALRELEAALGAPIRPRRAGWEIASTRGRVRVAGGLRGVRTLMWRPDGEKRVEVGWVAPDVVLAWLAPVAPPIDPPG